MKSAGDRGIEGQARGRSRKLIAQASCWLRAMLIFVLVVVTR